MTEIRSLALLPRRERANLIRDLDVGGKIGFLLDLASERNNQAASVRGSAYCIGLQEQRCYRASRIRDGQAVEVERTK